MTGIVPRGEEALVQVVEDAPDIVLLDIHLKGVWDGIETARLIHEISDIAVVYLTANSDDAMGIPNKIASSLNARGNVLKYLHRYSEAIESYKETYQIALATGSIKRSIAILNNIGDTYNQMKDYRKAIPYLMETRHGIEKTGYKDMMIDNYYSLAMAYAGAQQYDSAYYYHQEYSAAK